ncbi:MAG: hypothetical protein HYY17_14255 [Planctomycetes bacterium]|nr:hypothetical protein [Planctomycetota bacterium]
MNRLAFALLLAAGCARPAPPSYMQDAPRTEEDVRKILKEVEEELGKDFIVERQGEVFFFASNAGETSYDRCRRTVARMWDFLYADYLTTKPTKPIRIYLFKDKATYEAYCKKAYSKPPTTPYGFYMSCERKMVMNIATGTGTLAHELVHPLLAEDFPDVPSWFNEGFASLYEQSRQSLDGKMEGLVNWRLPSLQRALQRGEKISLRALTKTTTSEFYGDGSGLHYAIARYLCLYLQEKGKLTDFYKRFRKGFAEDKTGAAAIEAATGKKLDDLEAEWRKWVGTLKYED